MSTRSRRVDAGQLRHRINLQSAVCTIDALGGTQVSWQTVGNFWAGLETVAAQTFQRAGTDELVVTHRFVIRHRNDVSEGMRLEKEGRVFLIKQFFDPDETGRYLTLLTTEDIAQ